MESEYIESEEYRMHELEHSLRHYGDTIAIVASGLRLTYRELDAYSRKLAAQIPRLGLPENALMVIYAGRTADLVISIVTALRIGRPYTIVEPGENAISDLQRLASLGPTFVLSEDRAVQPPGISLGPTTWDKQVGDKTLASLTIDGSLDKTPAYVLFTSGSTGKPKGVVVTQGNISHYTSGLRKKLAIPNGLCYAHVSTFGADLGNTSLFLSLLTGGTLHVVSDACRKDPSLLSEYLATEEIQFLKITPSHWGLVLQMPLGVRRFCLEYLVLGGEPLSTSLAAASLASGMASRVVNHYGPTETTIGVLAHIVEDGDMRNMQGASVPIGTPFGETKILIETENGSLCNGEGIGELLIGGPSVATGYFKDPESTAKKFVTGLPPYPETRFYKSGDLVKRDHLGHITFMGRSDRQVKVRGHRVELDHVEFQLRGLPAVRDARVLAGTGPHSNHLAALLIPMSGPELDPHTADADVLHPVPLNAVERSRIQSILRQVLPEHMIPQHYFSVARFPLNANGKTDARRIDALLMDIFEGNLVTAVPPDLRPAQHTDDPILGNVIAIWRARLLVQDLALSDNFFSLGGNSIDAILMISDLQRKGYRISAAQFLQNPTIEALAALIESGDQHSQSDDTATARYESERLGIAQDWFFRQRFQDHDYWNQALLFDCSIDVDAGILSAVLPQLLERHPMLETRITPRGNAGWHAEYLRDVGSDCLTISTSQEAHSMATDADVVVIAEQLHQAIRVGDGKVFKVHLFRRDSQPDRLLFIAHHLVVDAVSWRILLDDLTHLYNAAVDHRETVLPRLRRSYWDWVLHLEANRTRLLEATPYWSQLVNSVLAEAGCAPSPSRQESNYERDSQAVWFALSAEELRRVTDAVASKFACTPSAALLGAFLHEYSHYRESPRQLVEIESHGRLTYDNFDVSRTVGWFTSAFPVFIECVPGNSGQTISATATALAEVPDLGAGYVPYLEEVSRAQQVSINDLDNRLRPPICFNYLGDLTLAASGALMLTPSAVSLGPARGANNSRVHELKLTARSVGGGLVVDIGFSREQHQLAAMQELLGRVRSALLRIGECDGTSAPAMCTRDSSSTGLLFTVPPQLAPHLRVSIRHNHYRTVLITGATGFLGCHFLKALLTQSDATIVCLVRKNTSIGALARLRGLFTGYFGLEHSDLFDARCRVMETVSQDGAFGLPQETYRNLSFSCEAIFHFAADTRLFANPTEVIQSNLATTRAAIEFAETGRPKHLHHMSTLAVAGINPRTPQALFSERHLDIGQELQNPYELSKYQAELLVRDHIANGGVAYIYRSGNVSGHSQNGRFSHSGGDNRIVQILHAVAELGRAPMNTTENIALTPVDDVINACLVISSDPSAAGAVYHLDNGVYTKWTELFYALRAQGVSLEQSPANSLRELFSHSSMTESPVIAMGRLWVNRPDRNIVFDCRATQSFLSRRGFSYHGVDSRWLKLLVSDLAARGFLGMGSRDVPVNHALLGIPRHG